MLEITNSTIVLYDESPSPDVIIIRAEMPGHSPESLWQLWTTSEGVKSWWNPKSVSAEVKVGGEYVFAWSKWTLRGNYLEVEPNEKLTFTWAWDKSKIPARKVNLEFEEDGNGGTVLTLTHGIYSNSDGNERQSHIDGWLYFLPILAEQPPR